MKTALGIALALVGIYTAQAGVHVGNPAYWIEGSHTIQTMDCTTGALTTVSLTVGQSVSLNSTDDNICELVFRGPNDDIVISNELPAGVDFTLNAL